MVGRLIFLHRTCGRTGGRFAERERPASRGRPARARALMTPKSQEARPRKAPGRLKQAARTKTGSGRPKNKNLSKPSCGLVRNFKKHTLLPLSGPITSHHNSVLLVDQEAYPTLPSSLQERARISISFGCYCSARTGFTCVTCNSIWVGLGH
jgi:hypothetical protein